jgi:hypothetical protein
MMQNGIKKFTLRDLITIIVGPKMLNNMNVFGNLKIIIRGPLFPFVGFSN